MAESIILIDGNHAAKEALRHMSGLSNAKQLFVGRVPDGRHFILYVAGNSAEDITNAVLRFAAEPGVRSITPLMISNNDS
ncbi:MAG: hypothetical protein R3293_11880 [Candidatus Promineifilaceae bacterium]|nr:hypothetical protein [Candidatus Promineifilaceae bacterium]